MNEFDHRLQKKREENLMSFSKKSWSFLYWSFLGGLARGFGIAVGLTIIAGLFILILTKLASLNLPIIGKYLAELVTIINEQIKLYP